MLLRHRPGAGPAPGRAARRASSCAGWATAFLVYLLVPLWLLLHRRRFDVVIDCMNGIPFFAPLVVRRRTPVICVVHHVHDRQFHAFFPRWLAGSAASSRGRWPGCSTAAAPPSPSRSRPGRSCANGCAGSRPIADRSPTAAPPPARSPPAERARRPGDRRTSAGWSATSGSSGSWTSPPSCAAVAGLHVHVVGRGPERERLAARARELGVGRPGAPARVPRRAGKNAVLGAARLNVTASEFEGWGLTVIEAAALGVPTVAYDVAGLRDSVRHGVTGWLVRDGERLADVVGRALEELADPVRRGPRCSEACRAWAREFTWGAPALA